MELRFIRNKITKIEVTEVYMDKWDYLARIISVRTPLLKM